MTNKPATCGDCVNRGHVRFDTILHRPALLDVETVDLYECRLSCAKITYEDPACGEFKEDGVWICGPTQAAYFTTIIKKDEQEREQE